MCILNNGAFRLYLNVLLYAIVMSCTRYSVSYAVSFSFGKRNPLSQVLVLNGPWLKGAHMNHLSVPRREFNFRHQKIECVHNTDELWQRSSQRILRTTEQDGFGSSARNIFRWLWCTGDIFYPKSWKLLYHRHSINRIIWIRQHDDKTSLRVGNRKPRIRASFRCQEKTNSKH